MRRRSFVQIVILLSCTFSLIISLTINPSVSCLVGMLFLLKYNVIACSVVEGTELRRIIFHRYQTFS
ncbi:Uncharacterised protein [Enterobacter cancerogenus]|uniref:Uncharacterized protein n=1 Tax=Enterobacter cancerogenus TaxID=69218 RepID=A0A484YY14_9ENTR|nr:Uncharacterised protein [Enterobacter cancerogenus]